jgi:RNA polymerase sigma-70 factor (ECF subfamily)
MRFHALVHEHCAFVWRTLRRFGVEAANADDAAQEVFMVLSTKLADVEPGKEKWFLFHTAVNVAKRGRRSRARSRESANDDAVAEHADPAHGPEENAARREAIALLDAALAELDADLKTVFVLCDIEEATMADAAIALELPAGTVASRLRRARERMQESIRKIRRQP